MAFQSLGETQLRYHHKRPMFLARLADHDAASPDALSSEIRIVGPYESSALQHQCGFIRCRSVIGFDHDANIITARGTQFGAVIDHRVTVVIDAGDTRLSIDPGANHDQRGRIKSLDLDPLYTPFHQSRVKRRSGYRTISIQRQGRVVCNQCVTANRTGDRSASGEGAVSRDPSRITAARRITTTANPKARGNRAGTSPGTAESIDSAALSTTSQPLARKLMHHRLLSNLASRTIVDTNGDFDRARHCIRWRGRLGCRRTPVDKTGSGRSQRLSGVLPVSSADTVPSANHCRAREIEIAEAPKNAA